LIPIAPPSAPLLLISVHQRPSAVSPISCLLFNQRSLLFLNCRIFA
jgi:hypothetical protein